jgi:hypothetical protein
VSVVPEARLISTVPEARLISTALRTVWLYAAAGFGYVALSAVFRPRQLGTHLWHDLPWLRKDTFGIGCFAASALAYLLLRLTDRLADPVHANRRLSVIPAVLGTIALYGIVAWAYIAGNAIRHPYTLSHPLTHLVPWPREDDFGAACFAASAIAYFLFRLTQTGGAQPAKAADARE